MRSPQSTAVLKKCHVLNKRHVLNMLNCFYSNVDCLSKTEKQELQLFIQKHLPDIIGLTEIWPKNHLFELDKDFFQFEQYDMFINNLQSSRGVIIYIKNTQCNKCTNKF